MYEALELIQFFILRSCCTCFLLTQSQEVRLSVMFAVNGICGVVFPVQEHEPSLRVSLQLGANTVRASRF